MLAPFDNIIIQIAQPAILPQVKRFFREHGFRAQAPRGDIIHLALRDQQLLAALRLCPVGEAWLLRSMCVHQDHRQRGIGSFMLQQIQSSLQQRACYCFPHDYLEDFYRRAGFVPLQPAQAPAAIAERYHRYRDQGRSILLMKYQGDTE